MKKVVCLILLFSASFILKAHNSKIATMALVQGEDSQWILQLSSSLDEYKKQLQYHYPNIDSTNLPQEEFQKLLIQYLEESIKLTANDNYIAKFKNGHIKMGYQTIIQFETLGLPDKLKSLSIALNGFDQTSAINCAFKIITSTNVSKNFVLKGDNNFKLFLYKRGNQFKVVTAEEANLSWVVVGLGSLAVLTMFIVSKLFEERRRPVMRKVN